MEARGDGAVRDNKAVELLLRVVVCPILLLNLNYVVDILLAARQFILMIIKPFVYVLFSSIIY